MSVRRAVRALLLAAFLVPVVACSPGAPPAYRLDGDACGTVPMDPFQALSGQSSPSKTPSDLKPGLSGGNCDMEFDGTTGYFKLTTFIAIHPTGADAAKEMYTTFKTSDNGKTAKDTTVSDVAKLGSQAYLFRQHLDPGAWKRGSGSLYKYVVQDGALVLTLTFSGFARNADAWPATEQGLEDKLVAAVKQIMTKLKP